MQNLNSERQADRQSNIEILRIISMIMIVFQHFAYHSNFDWQSTGVTLPRLWYNFIAMGGQVGVDVFVLITGFFLINSNSTSFHFKRILKFWGQVVFYSVVLYFVLGFLGLSGFRMKSLIQSFFPITLSSWWFASAYFLLYIIHPFLNAFLRNLEKKTYQSLLVMLVIIWSVIPTFTNSLYGSNDLLWFSTLYAIAGYVRLYGFNNAFTTKQYFRLWLITSVITYSTSVIIMFMSTKWDALSGYVTYFYSMEKVTVLLSAVSLFMTFATLKIRNHKWINVLATATFGVYLIHDQSLVRYFLWERLFKGNQYQDSLFLIPYSIGAVFVVYFVCTVIDLGRKQILENPYMYIVNRYADTAIKPFSKVIDFVKKTVLG